MKPMVEIQLAVSVKSALSAPLLMSMLGIHVSTMMTNARPMVIHQMRRQNLYSGRSRIIETMARSRRRCCSMGSLAFASAGWLFLALASCFARWALASLVGAYTEAPALLLSFAELADFLDLPLGPSPWLRAFWKLRCVIRQSPFECL